MDLFHEDGHITNLGLQDLCNETLDEMSRLEVSEHLGFCDECMERYLEVLENGPMVQPRQPLRPLVENRIRLSRWKVVLGKAATVAAALLLATGLWASNVFTGFSASSGVLGAVREKRDQQPFQLPQWDFSLMQKEDEVAERLKDAEWVAEEMAEEAERTVQQGANLASSGLQNWLRPRPESRPLSQEEELQIMLEEIFPERQQGRRPTGPAPQWEEDLD